VITLIDPCVASTSDVGRAVILLFVEEENRISSYRIWYLCTVHGNHLKGSLILMIVNESAYRQGD
jgi:hypothetical protein